MPNLGRLLSDIFKPSNIFVQPPPNILNSLLHNILGSIINIFLLIAGALAVIFFMYSGVFYITSGGDQEKADKGKKGVIFASIGILIIALSFGIVRYLSRTLSGELATGQFTGETNERASNPLSAQSQTPPSSEEETPGEQTGTSQTTESGGADGEPTPNNRPGGEDHLFDFAPPDIRSRAKGLIIVYRAFPQESAPLLRVSGCEPRQTCRARAISGTIRLNWENSGIYQLRISGPKGTSYVNVFGRNKYNYRPWASGYYTFSVRKIIGFDMPDGKQWLWSTSPWSNSARVLVSPVIQF